MSKEKAPTVTHMQINLRLGYQGKWSYLVAPLDRFQKVITALITVRKTKSMEVRRKESKYSKTGSGSTTGMGQMIGATQMNVHRGRAKNESNRVII